MLKGFIKAIKREQKGITGLETAIILIAFVVVAAVFAYTALSAGLFSTQKGQEAVYSGLKEAQSTLEIRGGVIAKATAAGGNVKQVTFTVSSVLGGEPIDFTPPTANTTSNNGRADIGSNNTVVISYVDSNQRVEDLFWTIDKLGSSDTDDILEPGEKFQITIGATGSAAGGGNLVSALTTALGANQQFTIEIKPAVGAVLTIQRTTPAYIDTVMDLK
jgi:flagellin FlaB